jgi:hypothetical protein
MRHALLPLTLVMLAGCSAGRARLDVDRTDAQFGTIEGATAAQPITITVGNSGDAPTGVLSTELSGDVRPFHIDVDACASRTLAPQRSCTIRLSFAPDEGGDFRAVLRVGSSRDNYVDVVLQGQAASAALDVTPIDTIEAVPGAGITALTTVRNSGGAPTGPLSILAPAGWSGGDNCDGRSLVGGESCAIGLRHDPLPTGATPGATTNGTLTVRASPGGSVDTQLVLEVAPTARLAVENADFGSAAPQSSVVVTVTVTNQGPQTSSPLSLTSNPADTFRIYAAGSDECSGKMLPSHANCRVQLTASAAVAGDYTGTLTVTASGSNVATSHLDLVVR